MHRNLSHPPGDGSDGRAPTEAWLFAQAVRGKPIPKIVRPEVLASAKRAELERLAQFSSRHAKELRSLQYAEAEARHDRELLEWAAQISTKCADELRALQRQEAEEAEAWRRAERFVEKLQEGASETRQSRRRLEQHNQPYLSEIVEWNADQPRQPKGTPEGGQWAPKGGGGSTNAGGAASTGDEARGEQGRRRAVAATTTPYSTSGGIPVHLAAAKAVGGHHWVPQVVFGNLESKMIKGAVDIFKAGTKSPEFYDHAFDTWNGVTHGEYSGAMRKILEDWIEAGGGRIDEDGARVSVLDRKRELR
jgi:hypothetical protein